MLVFNCLVAPLFYYSTSYKVLQSTSQHLYIPYIPTTSNFLVRVLYHLISELFNQMSKLISLHFKESFNNATWLIFLKFLFSKTLLFHLSQKTCNSTLINLKILYKFINNILPLHFTALLNFPDLIFHHDTLN